MADFWSGLIGVSGALVGVGITQWHQRRMRAITREDKLIDELRTAYAQWGAAAQNYLWRVGLNTWSDRTTDISITSTEANRSKVAIAVHALVLLERQPLWAKRVQDLSWCMMENTWIPARMGKELPPNRDHPIVLNSAFAEELGAFMDEVRCRHPDLRRPSVIKAT